MLISITGSTNDIAKAVIDHISSKIENVEFDCWSDDTDDKKSITNFMLYPEADYVIHLHEKTDISDPDEIWQHNVIYSQEVFNQCKMHKTRAVYLIRDDNGLWWENPYSASKKAEQHIATRNSIGIKIKSDDDVQSVAEKIFTALQSDKKGVYTLEEI